MLLRSRTTLRVSVREMKIPYLLINGLCHACHVMLIAFMLVGWIWPWTRPGHLAVALLTLGSWFILGIWMGKGYCPITEWQWKIKDSIGEGRPKGTYIHLLLQRVSGASLDSVTVDKYVVLVTLAVTGVSLVLNARQWWTR
jgi:fatty acid desaturase